MTWRDDGTGNLTVSGAKVSFTGSGNSKGNAIWSQGGTGSWEFNVTGSSGSWVGVSAEDKFAAGWGMKGLFYGGPGNLSDGSSLVTSRWGYDLSLVMVMSLECGWSRLVTRLYWHSLKMEVDWEWHLIFLATVAWSSVQRFP